MLGCLCSNPIAGAEVLLRSVQRDILRPLCCWQDIEDGFGWYAGSALINASALADHSSGLHTLDFYEQQPETRRILETVLGDIGCKRGLFAQVLAADRPNEQFDGEGYIEQQICGWGRRNVVLLDPFAMWRQPQDQVKRDRYAAVLDALVRRGPDAPCLVLFWTWGRAFRIAEGDLNGTTKPVKNGYQELRRKLHKAGLHFVLIRWRWGLQFAMWVLIPGEHLAALRKNIDAHCRVLTDHLVRHGCKRNLRHPRIKVTID